MTTPFSQPGKSESFAPKNHPEWHQKLFLIYPDAVDHVTFKVEDGPKKVVDARVEIIDLINPQTGSFTVLDGARIGGAALVPQLVPFIGGMVLGRLSKLPNEGPKDGAFKLDDFTPADSQLAMAHLAAHPRPPKFVQPAAQAPAPGGWGAAVPAAPALPYDPWASVPGAQPAPAQQPPAPAWGAPPAAAPAPVAAYVSPTQSAPQVEPALVAFLTSKGVQVTPDMTQETALMIAKSFPS